ncbi:MAG: ATP-binding protein [Candidatus Helarchaeota archaeon]
MKKITVVSGKGGVGKTTLTASLACLFARDKYNIVITDCDVDAPNLAITLSDSDTEREDVFSANIAIVDQDKCIGCQECLNHCKFRAITWNEQSQTPIINEFECEGCGVCTLVCPEHCIELTPIKTGELITSVSQNTFPIISGELVIGRGNSGKIVAEAKMKSLKLAEKNKSDLILNDGPPGIGCPVIASLSDSDFIIIITEPMPAAIHDLKRVLTLAWNFTREIGLIINKYDLYPPLIPELETFAKENDIRILGTIPIDKAVPESLVNLLPIIEFDSKAPASVAIEALYQNLKEILKLKN